jgi:hypothetical protein
MAPKPLAEIQRFFWLLLPPYLSTLVNQIGHSFGLFHDPSNNSRIWPAQRLYANPVEIRGLAFTTFLSCFLPKFFLNFYFVPKIFYPFFFSPDTASDVRTTY